MIGLRAFIVFGLNNFLEIKKPEHYLNVQVCNFKVRID